VDGQAELGGGPAELAVPPDRRLDLNPQVAVVVGGCDVMVGGRIGVGGPEDAVWRQAELPDSLLLEG